MTKLRLIHKRWRYHNPSIINEQTIIIDNTDDYVESLDIEVYDESHDDFPIKVIEVGDMCEVSISEKKEGEIIN